MGHNFIITLKNDWFGLRKYYIVRDNLNLWVFGGLVFLLLHNF